ncbi:MAG: hypothetical protein H5U40_15680 [Polyangiaceae bacterium]|nr:hypothetical protein [Polyangiaceae bacterium]
MRRHLFGSLFVLACIAASGCTDDTATMWITGLRAPDENCVASDILVGAPSIDPASGASYTAFLSIANAIRGNGTDIANDSNWVALERIEVTLTSASGDSIDVGSANPYSMPIGGLIPSAASASEPSEATVVAVILPASAVAALPVGQYVVATIQPFGHTLGGIDVEGAPFSMPIFVSAPSSCTRKCPDEASGADLCTPGQDGGCPPLLASDPACQ